MSISRNNHHILLNYRYIETFYLLEERRAKKSKVEYEEYVEEDTTEAEPTKGILFN